MLKILKANSFLFYELFSRKYSALQIFHEIPIGSKHRCDFAWVNDDSAGPEWVLVEVEKPRMRLFIKNGDPHHKLNHAIEQVRSWDRYFENKPSEKKRIFGAVAGFKFILVAGSLEDWNTEAAMEWRSHFNSNNNIEIRSSDVFMRALKVLRERPDELWSFAERPTSLGPSELENYWKDYDYFDKMRKIF